MTAAPKGNPTFRRELSIQARELSIQARRSQCQMGAPEEAEAAARLAVAADGGAQVDQRSCQIQRLVQRRL